jgi:hypothetical protein
VKSFALFLIAALGADDCSLREAAEVGLRLTLRYVDIRPYLTYSLHSPDVEIAHRAGNILADHQTAQTYFPYLPRLTSLSLPDSDPHKQEVLRRLGQTSSNEAVYAVADGDLRWATGELLKSLYHGGWGRPRLAILVRDGFTFERHHLYGGTPGEFDD